MYQETPLNTDFGIKNIRQNSKIDTMGEGVTCGGEVRMNRGDEGEGRWLMPYVK
jgi:hypothetical protein